MQENQAHYWLEPVLDQIEQAYPDGKITISSGISPSASYHIGHFREILSADMILIGLKQRGRDAEHIHVVDNLDPLRKRYDFLPEEFEKYVKWPICLVPSPDGSDQSYADYFFNKFFKIVETMKLDVTVVKSYEDLYKAGKMTGQFEAVINNIETVRKIFKEVSNRDVEEDWTPIQVLSEDNKYINAKLSTWDKEAQTLEGVSYTNGKAKLNWRLDWPARWQVLGVQVEPFSMQELGAAGSAYETGIEFSRQVFNNEPPIPGIKYGMVHLPGDNFKMSSSKNNLVTPEEVFKIMPPVAVRYFYARYPGKNKIVFDPGLGLLKMLDEYSAVDKAVRNGEDHEYAPAYKIASAYQDSEAMSSIPFSHLVSVYQAALGDESKIFDALKRTEYANIVDDEQDKIKGELDYVSNWLEKWAPENVKFEIKDSVPDVELSDAQKELLAKIADGIESENGPLDGPGYHELVYSVKEELGLEPKQAFQAIYRVILGKDYGPKAGWFLSILEPDWLVSRFRLQA